MINDATATQDKAFHSAANGRGGDKRRRHQRAAAFLPVEIVWGASSEVARLCDLSNSGANVIVDAANAPEIGQKLSIILLDGTMLDGCVVRREGCVCAIEFDLYVLGAEELLSFEHMGKAAFEKILHLQRRQFEGPQRVIGYV